MAATNGLKLGRNGLPIVDQTNFSDSDRNTYPNTGEKVKNATGLLGILLAAMAEIGLVKRKEKKE
ncbi:LPXTG cell wall anchor domain-containing protein [Melissococcus plutonius]|uniref:Gram-positive cocci surface proteins LPxTG domain-containing protein n=1 Tax=Melissococcus plutonius (strain ATCC 35311 / DSM 29964 / CIP 104052 / LMG 20360 / NCIMB 702443) TaxID=940190 RepID=F3YCK7_MELPT|nr:LPXTG cell wall anchor domain-containing protein [Melissococcus plutonius]AIM26012.1 hypothetical protein MEPL_c016870 [Melissococcus plutonius S1]KMT23737.1 hypothetical protein MEPL2_4c00220 [Melissococcus plutonius]KMT24321.1 hypothetical protein MEPL1_9c00220 [Melissococcus plutonius]KMT27005.1 hypothetical protein MEPL3_1c00220 [Melissococcus plutonius]KMT28368.1 hypothetical protein MEPL4_6c00220 [Melissococcus plutonius]